MEDGQSALTTCGLVDVTAALKERIYCYPVHAARASEKQMRLITKSNIMNKRTGVSV